jgi:hypothetical protein
MRIITLAVIFLFFLTRCDRIAEENKNSLPATKKVSGIRPESSAVKRESSASLPESRERVKAEKVRKKNSRVQPLKERMPDSTRLARIMSLHSQNRVPDLNEPVSREAVLNPAENAEFQSMIELSRESFLKVNFDNDILNNTDMYYTNGMRIDFIFPFVQGFVLSKLMIPYWGSGTNYYGFSLFQNMYTPSTTKTGGIRYGDRPYAAYLCLGLFKITNDLKHRFRQTSELDLGIIGPYSFGEFVQKAYHNNTPTNNEPLGWEYQIRNDLVLNYNLTLEKGLVHSRYFEFNVVGSGAAGTLYTNIEGGFHLRAGLMNPYFSNLGLSKKARNRELGLRNTQVFFFLKSSARLVGYDATLQGGLFNHSSPYTIPGSELSRFMSESSAGFSFVLNGIRLDAEQYFLSSEFHGGKWHFWVHVGLTFAL